MYTHSNLYYLSSFFFISLLLFGCLGGGVGGGGVGEWCNFALESVVLSHLY